MPYSYAGTMGLLQGESMAARFFHQLGASLLDRTICSSAGGEALAATYGAKVGMHVEHYRREPADRDLGQQLDHLEPALLDPRAAGQARRRQAGLHRPAPHRDGRQVPPAHRAAARHRRRAGARRDARADRATTGSTTTTSSATSTAGRRCASARCNGRPSAPPRCAASRPTRCAAWRATTERPQPAAIRLNYGMQRVRGGGNAARLIALLPCLVGAWRHRAGGLLLSSVGLVRAGRDDAALQRPDLLAGRRPRTINMSTIGDDLLRERRAVRRRHAVRPEDRGAGRLQQQPGRGRAASRRRSRAASRARTCSPSCSSTS